MTSAGFFTAPVFLLIESRTTFSNHGFIIELEVQLPFAVVACVDSLLMCGPASIVCSLWLGCEMTTVSIRVRTAGCVRILWCVCGTECKVRSVSLRMKWDLLHCNNQWPGKWNREGSQHWSPPRIPRGIKYQMCVCVSVYQARRYGQS